MGNIKKLIYSGRKFVNLPGEEDTGSIQAEIIWRKHRYDDDNEDYPGYIDYLLKFADCSRSIDFSINGESEQERKNAIFKVSSMIETLEGFKEHLLEAFDIEDDIKRLNKARKEKENEEREKASKEIQQREE